MAQFKHELTEREYKPEDEALPTEKSSPSEESKGSKFRAIVALWVAFTNTISLGPLVVVFSFIPVIGRRIGEWLIWLWAKIFMVFTAQKVEYYGVENIKGRHAVFMSNHQSYLDSPILYYKLKRIKFIILHKFKNYPLFGWALWLQGHLFIHHGRGRLALLTLERAVHKLKRGTSILVFPEGQRQPQLGPFQKGGFRMALRSGLPIIPVAISGSWQALPKGRFRFYRRKIRVFFGKPIETVRYTEKQMEELVEKVREQMSEQIKLLERSDFWDELSDSGPHGALL